MVSELRIPFIAILEFQKRSAQRQSRMRYILVQFETRFSSTRLFTDFRCQAARSRCLLTSTVGSVRLRNKRTLRGFDCVNSALPDFVGSTDMLSSIFTLSQAAYNCLDHILENGLPRRGFVQQLSYLVLCSLYRLDSTRISWINLCRREALAERIVSLSGFLNEAQIPDDQHRHLCQR